nr:hypothetical protein [Lautropia sp.]
DRVERDGEVGTGKQLEHAGIGEDGFLADDYRTGEHLAQAKVIKEAGIPPD